MRLLRGRKAPPYAEGSGLPQIFINGASVGGYDDMAALEKRGKLDTLLQTAPPSELSALPS